MTATYEASKRLKLTSAAITKYLVPPPPGQRQTVLYDTEIPGFGIYRNGQAPGRFFVHFRVGMRQRKKMIGLVTEVSLADARAEAASLKVAARQGRDIIHERKLALERGITLLEAYTAFMDALERKGGSQNTIDNYEQNWRTGLLSRSSVALGEISKADIRSWHKKWGERGPTVANQTLRLFRAIYNHALRTSDGLPPNPSNAVDQFQEKGKREWLTWEALPVWLDDVARLENPVRRALWPFLLYSGLRRSDAASMRWDEVGKTSIHRPNPKGGRLKAFDLPLSSKLSEILKDARAAHQLLFPSSPYVFPANSASGHVETLKEKTIPHVAPHMLRRTFATACVEAGLDPYTTKRLLNHTVARGDVTALYVQQSSDFLQQQMERVSTFIDSKAQTNGPNTEDKAKLVPGRMHRGL